MKFDQIILKGTTSVTLFDLNNPRTTPYTAKSIDGLDPTDVDVTLAQTTGGSGIFIGRREQLREITMIINLNPNYAINSTPDMLRENIYLMQPVNADQSLDFCIMRNGQEICYCPVYIKRTEGAVFTKDTVMQLVLASTSGVFSKRTPETFTNPAIDKSHAVLPNLGSAVSGYRIEVEFTAAVNSFAMKQLIPAADLTLNKLSTETELCLSGDRLIIDTNIGKRGVWRVRSGVTQSMIGYLTRSSVWLSLNPGPQVVDIVVTPGPNSSAFIWRLYEYTPRYRGV